ncbi:Txe/YoeB family addiction module toxin [Candidatus Palauibacter sp.]|uniref:Txe/YoeB family addiction module toxin n=1 Tax=Candidatus Palauibacter sp. TaxID=3101350 RepID=UPI003B5AECF6
MTTEESGVVTEKPRDSLFHKHCLKDLLYWSKKDPKKCNHILKLISEACRDLATGRGKPEALSGDRSGQWSRRIDQKNRLLYKATNGEVKFLRARGHY